MIQGRLRVFSDAELERLNDAVLDLLQGTGCRVDHERMRALLAKRGCIVDEAHRIVRFPAHVIQEVVDSRRKSSHHGENGPKEVTRSNIAGEQFFLYDWRKGENRWAGTQDLLDIIHMGDALEEVDGVGAPVINSEVDPRFEAIETLALILKNTRKPTSMEVLHPEHVEYMARLGGIYTDRDYDGRFIAGCNFMISPLVMGHRATECLFEKAKYGISCTAGTQPVAGMSSPVTLAGTVVLGCAELLALWVMGKAVDPDVELRGGITSGSLDMRTGETCFSSPEAILQDIGVSQMFDELYGGGIGSDIDYIDAKVPGLQAAFERAYKGISEGISTGQGRVGRGAGQLDAGAVFSPTQAMLDLDLFGAMWRYLQGMTVNEETIALEVLKQVGPAGNFLDTEHTLHHFRETWYPGVLVRKAWSEAVGGVGSEEQLLRRADDKWRAALAAYKPFELEPYKARAMDEVVRRAREKLGDLEMSS